MRRVDIRLLALLLALGLAGCASAPKPPPEPPLRQQARQAEASGARRYTDGLYAAAARHFAEAVRLHQSLDDAPAAARNRLQLAQTWLLLGQPQAALEQTSQVHEDALQVAALLLQVQARLALDQAAHAQALLQRLQERCPAGCEQRGRVLLLQARLAWQRADAAQTVQQAAAAVPLLRARGEEREVANALRLLAAAQWQNHDAPAALAAAQAALVIDRQQALPEKIARDWLLIGDIQRRTAPGEARAAYERAHGVARAAGLQDLARQADQLLKETSP